MTLKTLAALQEKATKGPWKHEGFLTVFGPNGLSLCHTSAAIEHYGRDEAVANAEFLSACGSFDFTALCDEMESLKAENREHAKNAQLLQKTGVALLEAAAKLARENEALVVEMERMRKALEFYADPENHKVDLMDLVPVHRLSNDKGQRAREALGGKE